MGGNSHGFEFSRTLSCAKPMGRIGHIRHKSHKRHIKNQGEHTCLLLCFLCLLCLMWRLTANGNAQRSDVATGVKGSQGDCVFAGSKSGEVEGVDLVAAISNAVVRKDWDPSAAVETRIRLFNFARSIVGGKNYLD